MILAQPTWLLTMESVEGFCIAGQKLVEGTTWALLFLCNWIVLNLVEMAISVTIGLLLWLASRATSQDCMDIRPVHMCNDLCDESLEDARVREVHFGGIIASLGCIPSSVKVREILHT